MAYRSRIDELARMRVRGQRPDLYVVVGTSNQEAAYAARNGFFYVPASEIGEEVSAFVGLNVLIRSHDPWRLSELAQRLALTARMVTVFDQRAGRSEFLVA